MKMKRMIASVLALLLMVSILPIGVMAAEDNNAGQTVDVIASDDTMNSNMGIVTTNNGEVRSNHGTVETNNGTIEYNYYGGTVSTNSENGIVETNYGGTIETNNGAVETNSQGTIETNKGEVLETGLGSTVETNAKDGKIGTNNGTVGKKDESGNAVAGTGNNGTIETNNGTVITNNEGGTVGKKDTSGKAVAGTGNNGTIETNSGTVITNNETGTVETNAAGGEIETNEGKVGAEEVLRQASKSVLGENASFEDITKEKANAIAQKMETENSGNFGTITDNKGKIYYNGTDGFIETNDGDVNLNKGKVETNKMFVGLNTGTVETTNGYVGLNNGTVETNNWVMLQNNGTVETNNQYVKQNTGTVETNKSGVYLNNGTVETNKEMVDRNNGTVVTNNGYVEQNTGTVVTNAIDGTVRNNPAGGNSTTEGVVNNFGTIHDAGETYYGLSWGENTDHLNLIDGAVKAETEKNLDEIASSVTRDGYRRTGYTAYYREGGKDIKIEETNSYIMNAPTWLKILWEKIVAAVESHEPEAKPEKKTSIPTTLSADQVKVGAYVRQGNLLFRIIEVNDDSIRVVIVGKLSEQALADMLGFLKQHLSDAQIAKINGEPALLEQELVTYFFGGTFEHISFYAARDLFA